MTRRLIAPLALAAALSSAASAADFSPAILYDFGGKFDRSFNQSAAEGAERFHKASGIPVREYEIQNASEREQILRRFVRRGCTIIVAVGFTQASAVETVAKENPGTQFAVIDGTVDLPNVQSINFKEQESSFLCGMAAAMATKTSKVGFVGGMDIPLIRKFAVGYKAGVAYVDPKIEVFENMTGSTPAAWTNPGAGAELAKSQFGHGVDVVFHAAGATGIGVMQAAADAGLLSIGCDSNQDYLHPGSVLTSALKRVDVAVWTVFTDAKNGTWKPGPRVLGLAEDGVGYSLDADNRKLITPEMEQRLNRAKADIIAGKVTVPEYTSP
jgi:basic membrane protein A